MRNLMLSFFGVLIILVLSTNVHADIYVLEDFESYNVGDSLDSGDLWVTHQDANAPGEASDTVSWPQGGQSGYFPGQSGIKHVFAAGDLPQEFVISVYYYHDSSGDPPHYMLVFKGPGGSDWLGVGTVETVSNYSLRDKAGTGAETDTGVKRKDWVNIVWKVSKSSTDILLDGEEVYSSITGGEKWSSDGAFLWFADVWAGDSEAYLDTLIIADTLEEIDQLMAVEPGGKLSTSWAGLKIVR